MKFIKKPVLIRKPSGNTWKKEDFSDSPATVQSKSSILDPFKATIRQWLEEDRKHWSKQHHTAQRVYDRLVEEHGYTGNPTKQSRGI